MRSSIAPPGRAASPQSSAPHGARRGTSAAANDRGERAWVRDGSGARGLFVCRCRPGLSWRNLRALWQGCGLGARVACPRLHRRTRSVGGRRCSRVAVEGVVEAVMEVEVAWVAVAVRAAAVMVVATVVAVAAMESAAVATVYFVHVHVHVMVWVSSRCVR